MSNTLRILITGGNRGLGFAYAKALLASPKGQDYQIYITARSGERAQNAAEKLDAQRIKGFGCDVEDEEQSDGLVKAVEEAGGVDVLINNAGGCPSHPYVGATYTPRPRGAAEQLRLGPN